MVLTSPTSLVTDTGDAQVGQACSDRQVTPEVALPQLPDLASPGVEETGEGKGTTSGTLPPPVPHSALIQRTRKGAGA